MIRAMRYGRMVIRAFGWRGLARRAAYMARLRSGALKWQTAASEDFSDIAPVRWHHRFDLDEIRARYAQEGLDDLVRASVVAEAKRVLAGEQQLYGHRWHEVGWPPRWHVNVFTGHEYPRVHWTAIDDDDPEHGDIKDVWELSRLPFTFLFARAYVLTGDDTYVEAWWEAIEDWAAHNPPNLGVNWRCGQESSLRAIALSFGLSAFVEHPASTPARLDLAGRILGATVARVRPTVGYALSQRNNHAVSELTFLLSVRAGDERTLLRLLIEVIDDQFYPDGSYSQQSFTYQRLAVHALQWLLLTRPDLPPGARSRIVDVLARSRDFLARCSDPVSGWLPNYGPTDGALLLHLSAAHYRDFRPLLASLGQPSDREHREAAVWLPLPDVADRKTDANSQPTTYHTLRGPRSLAFMRIGSGRHRPGHGDQQAIDLWIDGHNVVVDPGTYRYTAPPPWRNALTGPEVHSTLQDPVAERLALGRFLEEGMRDAELITHADGPEHEIVVSRRPMERGWLWRAVVRRDDVYAVVDTCDGVEAGAIGRWNLGDTVAVDVRWFCGPSMAKLRPVSQAVEAGWHSPLYSQQLAIAVHLARLSPGDVGAAQFALEDDPQLSEDEVRRALRGYLPNLERAQQPC